MSIIHAFDADSLNKPGLNFATAKAQGYTHCYIKLGGNNMPGNAPYVMSSNGGYRGMVQRALDAGLVVGNYWVTGGNDPVYAARFYLANRDPRTSFDVLDNETLDAGRSWSDSEAAAFFDTLSSAGLSDLWQYGSRDSLWNSAQWVALQARGIKAIVAIYNGQPLTNCYPRTYPSALVKGHQYTSSASIGGIGLVDANAFTADAFRTTSKGDRIVQTYHSEDRTARALAPGEQTFLHNDSAGLDVNIVGGIGPYVITSHIYADGLTPGDALDVALIWENTANAEPWKHASEHYTQRLVADTQGVIRDSTTFQRGVVSGDMVFVRVTAPSTNRGPAQVSLIDADAALFA